jgi:very-short-patch-repair endonuclease
MKQRIHNKPELKSYRKHLRNNGTSAEAVLWCQLKNRQLENRKFRRQHSIGYYIVDFYCPQEKLVIELDGEDHFWGDQINEDERRDEFLRDNGIRIIRFENKWIFKDMAYVLNEIRKHFINA